jgi:hypothetical protein
MAEQIQGIRNAAATLSGLVRRGLNLTRAEVMRQRETARARAAHREASRAAEWAAFEAAMARFESLLEDMLTNYSPAITQAEINAVTWKIPDLVERILEDEVYRIRSILRPLMRNAGFPLGTRDSVLDEKMDREWERAHASFHSKAFGNLKLPPYFCFQVNGTLNYEPIFWEKQYLYEGYVGKHSGHRYSTERVLAPVSS